MNACGNARLVRPLKKPCIYARILNGTDARTVRPYIPTSVILMHKMADEASYSNACRDARLVRPLEKPRIYARILNGTDARTVRPYIPTSVILMHKMADEASYSNACRDARPVRPLKKPYICACILNGTDARTVRPYMPLARKSSCHSANPKVQCSKFNVQSPSPYIAGMAILPRNIS